MRRIRSALGFLVVPLAFACASGPRSPGTHHTARSEEEALPLVRVRLYASGVGYFERHGELKAGQRSVPVPAGHLDDALKSLMVLGQGDEGLSVTFPSRLSPAVARARAGLPAADDAAISFDRLVAALRGEEVEVELVAGSRQAQGGTPGFTGRVVEVVAVEPSHPGYDHGPAWRTVPKDREAAPEPTRLHVVLLTDEKSLVRLDITDIASVRPLEPSVAERLEAAMAARIAGRSNQSQWLDLTAGGRGLSELRLAYLAETPTWRASYRLMLADTPSNDSAGARHAAGARKAAELQGWALVHNDTDEPWKGILLELVDGYPSSFLFPLAAPRYRRRPLEIPAAELSSVPQLSTATPDAMWGDFSDYQGETITTLSGYEGGGGSGSGFGSGHGRLGGSHRAPELKQQGAATSVGSDASDLLWIGDLVAEAGVTPKAERAISVYRVPQALSLGPRHSALLRFLATPLAAKPIVWFSSKEALAERAVALSNDSTHSLPGGPLAVYRDGGFLGEAMLDGLQPGARQFARIGDEPDTELRANQLDVHAKRLHVSFDGATFAIHTIRTDEERWVFDNRTGSRAEVYVGLDAVRNASVSGADRIDYDSTTSTSFAVFDIPPGSSSVREVTVREALSAPTPLGDLESAQLDDLASEVSLPSRERDVLRDAIPALEARRVVVRELAELEVERAAVDSELGRLRKDAESLSSKESTDTSRALTERVLERHDELRSLENRKRGLEKKLEARTKELGAALARLDAFRAEIIEERERLRGPAPQRLRP